MAREKGGVIACLKKAAHHVSSHKVNLILGATSRNIVGDLQYRFDLVEGEIQTAIAQLEKIKKAAEEKGYQDILGILREEVEFGHDL